jgi:peptide deformylase
MTILNILEFPDAKLRTKAAPVEVVNEEIKLLIKDMFDTMYDAKGIGLAATQVDVHQRIIVMDLSEESDAPKVFINPEITVLSAESREYDEGCLSVPGYYETVERPAHVKINALDENGDSFEIEADEMLATCIQHEIDHLEGKLFVDYISSLKRGRIRKKLEKQHKQQAQQQ